MCLQWSRSKPRLGLVEMQTRVNENEIKFEEDISFQCWSQYSEGIYTSTLGVWAWVDGSARGCTRHESRHWRYAR